MRKRLVSEVFVSVERYYIHLMKTEDDGALPMKYRGVN